MACSTFLTARWAYCLPGLLSCARGSWLWARGSSSRRWVTYEVSLPPINRRCFEQPRMVAARLAVAHDLDREGPMLSKKARDFRWPESAGVLGVSTRTVRRWISTGDLVWRLSLKRDERKIEAGRDIPTPHEIKRLVEAAAPGRQRCSHYGVVT